MLKQTGAAVFFDLYGTVILYPGFGPAEHYIKELLACGVDLGFEEVEEAGQQVYGLFLKKQASDELFRRECDRRTTAANLWKRRALLENLKIEGDLAELAVRMYEAYLLLPDFLLDEEFLYLLKELRKDGFKVGIISNGPRCVRKVLERHGLIGRVDVVVISGEGNHEKPEPEIFLGASFALGVAPEDCFYVGDNPLTDVVGARNAGMTPVLIDRAGNYRGMECARIGGLLELNSVLGLLCCSREQKAAALA